jgi:hypothetical protein
MRRVKRGVVGEKKSAVSGQRSAASGQRSEVRGQRSEVRGQRSEVIREEYEEEVIPAIHNLRSTICYLLGGENLPGRFGAARPHRPTGLRHGAGRSMDGLDQDDPATVKKLLFSP